MATVTTGPYHIQCSLHGNGVANSSSYPVINADFKITFSRDTGSSTVNWQISENTWSGTSSGNGHYAFQFWAEPTINDQTPPEYGPYIMSKTSTSWTTSWWNQVSLFNPSGSFTSTSNVATLKLWVWSECTNSGGSCYGHGWRQVYAIDLAIPTYETFYTVSYNGNGGTPVPANQTKSSLSNLTLTSSIPTLPIRINYYNVDGSAYSKGYNRAFNYWMGYIGGSYSGTNYARGGIYSTNSDCTMVANWGAASFTVDNLVDVYVKLTYVYNGGSGGAAYTSKARAKDGWYTSSSGGTKYTPGASATSSSNLNLYARYGNATFNLSEMPTPVRSGYVFGGWYTDAGLTNKITSSYSISADANVYAKWIAFPVHLKQSNNWADIGPYVWKYSTSDNQWHQVAHIFKANNNTWTDISQ